LVDRLSNHSKTYRIPATTVDGNDVMQVRLAMSKAIQRGRSGKGPSFIECLTYRLRGHYEGDPAKYRELSQVSEWKKKDPIARFTRLLKKQKALSDEDAEAIERDARAVVDKAAEFALSSPHPAPEEVDRQVTA
jgi:acetoin:2,6-dichlorophenolindophenol oxidoreductase subunit alpha